MEFIAAVNIREDVVSFEIPIKPIVVGAIIYTAMAVCNDPTKIDLRLTETNTGSSVTANRSQITIILNHTQQLAGKMLNWIIPSATAQDLKAESGSPIIIFDDTGDEDSCSFDFDWKILTEGDDIFNSFQINAAGETPGPCFSEIPIIFIENDGTNGANSSENSIWIEPDGDIKLAADDVFIDRSASSVGIGTLMPSASLHVRKTETASIFVENTSAVEGPRELFEISNAGNAKFLITNTQAVNPSEWAFTNNGNDFRVSKQGSGVVEMQVFGGGNMNITGTLTEGSDRAAKTNFQSTDPGDVLDKVVSLPISRWQYKTTKGVDHLGPMAQDFYGAFGLGDTDKGISSLDSSGVALLAIQALADENRKLKSAHKELLHAYHALHLEVESIRGSLQENFIAGKSPE